MKAITRTFEEQRASELWGLSIAVQTWLDQHPNSLKPSSPDRNRWATSGFLCQETGDFAAVIIKNGESFWTHFLSDYFDGKDRKLLYSRLGANSMPNLSKDAIEFATNLAALFLLYDQMEGGVVSDPWSKAMYKNNELPAKRYVQTIPGLRAFDEEMDEAFRGRKLTKIVNSLANQFPHRRRDYWRQIFLHVANGGDGAARQIHTGPKLSDAEIERTLKALEGRSQAQAALKLDMHERSLKRRLKIMEARGIKIPLKKG